MKPEIEQRGVVASPRIPDKKTCRTCRRFLGREEFCLYQYTTNQGLLSKRLDSDCKKCAGLPRKLNREAYNAKQRKLRARPEVQERLKKRLERIRNSEKVTPKIKQCPGCKKYKQAEQFYARRSNGDGLTSRCRACIVEENADYVARNYEKHQKWVRTGKLMREYGITQAQFESILVEQGGHCAICPSKKRLCVDHDHKTKRVRGILCSQCNLALGNIREIAETALGLAKYIHNNCKLSPLESNG